MTSLRTLLPRLGQYALVLWAAASLNFALPHLAPGDPVDYLYGGDALGLSPQLREQVRATYGLDRPWWEQYGTFWTGLIRGDLGTSVTYNGPVTGVLLDYLPWTVALLGIATLLAFVLGTALGTWAAWHRGTRRETAAVVGMLGLSAMPGFWIGMILIAVFAVALGWFPSYGAVPITAATIDGAWWGQVVVRMVLPVTTLVLAGCGGFFLLARAAMTTVLDEPYIRLARSKGLPEWRIALGHGLRNALLPVYTYLSLELGVLLSGAVVVETVFAYPGLGRLIFEAVTVRDYPLLQGAFLLVTVGIIAANLLADVTYPLLDPRVRKIGAIA